MREATSEDDFVSAPVGSFLVDRSWGYFYPDEHLSGYVVWDRPSSDDFERLARVLPPALGTTTPHPMLVDLRAMVGLEPHVFQLAARYTTDNFEALRRGVTRLALIRSGGVLGATAAGFFSLVTAFAPVALFTDPEEALVWIDRRSYGSVLNDTLRRFEAARHASMLRDLRRVLDAHPSSNLAQISAELAVSKRTLQRRLGELGTSLKLELARARVQAGQRLLAETDSSVTEIAFQVGCKSPQHFSTLFKKATGDPPSAWRQRQRTRDK